MKICTCCKEEKSSTSEYFYVKRGKLESHCKVCRLKKQKEFTKKNPDINKEAARKYREKNREKIRAKYYSKERHEYTYFNHVKNKYGITKEDYHNMLHSQKGCCKICEKELTETRRAAVDHDHVTGKVRGLLCAKCNTGLGQFNDNPDLLLLACDYLLDFMEINEKEVINDIPSW